MSLLDDLDAGRPGPECAGDLELSRLLADELDADTAARRREHVSTCRACTARMSDLDAERRAFAAAPPWRLPEPAAPRRRWQWSAGALALAGAAVVLLLVLQRRGGDPGGDEPGTRTKGGVRFELFVERSGAVKPLGEGDEVHPGDRIQVLYSAASTAHLAVLSRDGAGTVCVYFPTGGDTTWAAAPGRGVGLPSSTELDDVVGSEALHLVACDRATPLAALRELARTGGTAPDGCTVEELHLTKRAPP